jgi:hypothetical protein
MRSRQSESRTDELLDNLSYRVESLKDMYRRGILGKRSPNPIERRLEIINNRREAITSPSHTRRRSRERSRSERPRSRRDEEEQANSEEESDKESEADDDEDDEETNQQEPDASKRVPPSFSEAAKNVR